MFRRGLAALVAALAFVASGGPASAKPDPAKIRADVEALARWFHATDAESEPSPSPTALVNRLIACGDAALRPVLDEGLTSTIEAPARSLRAEVAAVIGAVFDVAPPICDRYRACRFEIVVGAALPIETTFEPPNEEADDWIPNIYPIVRRGTLRPKPLLVKPSEMFAAMDGGKVPALDGVRAAAFGVALGEACLRAEGFVTELVRRARERPQDAVLLHGVAALGRPEAAAFLAERLTAEATRAAKSLAPDAAVAAAFHALRRADAKRCDATVAALPPEAQDAVFVSVGRPLAALRLHAAYLAATDDAARAAVLRRAMAVLAADPAPGTSWKCTDAAAEAAFRLLAAALDAGDPALRAAAAAAGGTCLGVRGGELVVEYLYDISPKGIEEDPHTPRRTTVRCDVGPTGTVEWTIRECRRALDAGEFTLRDPSPPRVFAKPVEVPKVELRRTLGSAVAPPAGFEPDAPESEGPLSVKGEWSDDGLALTLTNRGTASVAVAPAFLAVSRLRVADVFVPPSAVKPTYRFLDVELGPSADSVARTAFASKLRVVAPQQTFTWTVPVPADVRGVEHVRVAYREEPRVEGVPAAPWLTYFTPTWVR